MIRKSAQSRIGILLLLVGIIAVICTASVTAFMVQSGWVANTSASHQDTLKKTGEGTMTTLDIFTTTTIVTSTSAENPRTITVVNTVTNPASNNQQAQPRASNNSGKDLRTLTMVIITHPTFCQKHILNFRAKTRPINLSLPYEIL